MPPFPTSQPGHSDLAHTILPTGGDQATSLASTAASEMSKPTGAQPPLLAGDWPPPTPSPQPGSLRRQFCCEARARGADLFGICSGPSPCPHPSLPSGLSPWVQGREVLSEGCPLACCLAVPLHPRGRGQARRPLYLPSDGSGRGETEVLRGLSSDVLGGGPSSRGARSLPVVLFLFPRLLVCTIA